jgi:predicted MFS family arabinose efflux permease
MLREDRYETQRRAFDFVGFFLLSPGLALLLFGGNHADQWYGIQSVCVAIVLLVAFIVHAARQSSDAIIDVQLFRRRPFCFATITQFLTNGVAFSGQMLVPLYLTTVCHLSPTHAGWLMTPMGAGMLCSVPFLGNLSERFGFRPVALTGACVAMLGTIPSCIWLPTSSGRRQSWRRCSFGAQASIP